MNHHTPLVRTPALLVAALFLTASACAGDAPPNTDSAASSASAAATAAAGSGATTAAATGAADSAGGAAASAGMLDPNSASREQLMAVPGMTAAAADALVAGRPYQNMVAVDRALAALPEADRKTVYARVWKPIDLNAASKEEILLIPGVGPRMQHEFEEYRPYTSIEQFRREIGKYVDKTEVARLERYVMIAAR